MKKTYTYTHELDADRTLEVLRLDHIVIDFPTANILTETVIPE